MTVCAYCNTPLDPHAGHIWRRVVGWERKARGATRKSGSDIAAREPREEYACDRCIRRLQRGVSPTQTTFDERAFTVPYHYDPDAAGIVPEGVQILTVVAIDETTSKAGDPMWIVRLEDENRREVTEWIVQTPNIIDWKFKPLWQAAGLDWPKAATILDEQQLVDRQVQATIKHEETTQWGRQARIDGYVKPGEGTDVPFDATDFQPPPARATVPDDDDDIPFD